jgi:hypothetical protein
VNARNTLVASAALGLLSAGCASLIKKPITEKCEGIGVKGCGEIAEGVVLYAKGDQGGGRQRLEMAASLNSPKQLRELASSLQALERVKGIGEVVRILNGAATAKVVDSSSTGSAAAGGSTPKTSAGSGNLPTDAHHELVDSRTVVLDDSWTNEACFSGPAGADSARCSVATEGPMVMTDLVTSGSCPGEVVVGAGSGETPVWWLSAPKGERFLLQASRFVVGPGERVVFAVHPEPDTVAGTEASAPCYVAWSALRPEPVERRPVKLTSKQIRRVLGSLGEKKAGCSSAYGSGTEDEIVRVKVRIAGSTGRVTSAVPQDQHRDSPLGACIRAVVQESTFPVFEQDAMDVIVAVAL